ncbi:SCO1/SenC-domain-containing protein [Pilobolus umbonatus]|nr:SCO1/SenC-domain-containing protein [Pilobolus umbonatus]
MSFWRPVSRLSTQRPCLTSVMALRTPTVRRYVSTKEQIRTKAVIGPFTFKAAAAFLGVGAGLLLYFKSEKNKVEILRKQKEIEKNSPQSYGKPKLGGHYSLTNAETGTPFGSDDMKGRFALIYFGFTHCPDICPEELDKMADVVDQTNKKIGENILIPVFITCDPRRDTLPVVKEYIKDFHKDLIGLTGTEEDIRKVAKLFRVYVSSPPESMEEDDYLVDHSIFFYLMDPEGVFLDCYSQNSEANDVFNSFSQYYKAYIDNGGHINTAPILIKEK